MRSRSLVSALVCAGLLAGGVAAAATGKSSTSAKAATPAPVADISIPYSKFVLPNGLTLIVHEDHKAPVVAVNVWYHVGSKNEKAGKTGFAHLFEHLMFNGSENYNDDYFKPFDRVGATDMNGTTNFDRTNYFQNVPKNALDVALWMESDRMGHLLGAIDQAKLDEQRGVVQNEKRQGENQPYGKAFLTIFENTYPAGHPYSHSVIGSMEDLNAASLEDVQEWFKSYYGAANAVLSIAGDVDTQEVKKKVEHYFGDIPSGPPVGRIQASVARRTGTTRAVLQDRVPQARVYMVWNLPEWGAPDLDYLDLASEVLSTGKTSRLYERLVYRDQIATDVQAFVWGREIGSLGAVYATVAPGKEIEQVEQAIQEELNRFLKDGPTAAELARAKTEQRARFIRGIERIGGFGGKSDVLAESEVYDGSPEGYKVHRRRVETATASDLQQASRRWLSDGAFILQVKPFPEYETLTSSADRSKLPEAGSFPAVRFPAFQRAELSNGLKLVVAERRAVPVVNFELLVDAGYAADQGGSQGTASLAMDMLDEGTTTRSALQISQRLSELGAELRTGSNLDMSSVSLSALKDNLDESLEIFADVIRNPAFPQADFERLKKQQLARIQREKATPVQMALRVLPKLLYGHSHAYGLPFTGSGTEASVGGLTREQLAAFHSTWFQPGSSTLLVVGDTTLDAIRPRLEKLFASWTPGKAPAKNIASVDHQPATAVYLVDRPDSLQSVIFAGHVAPPKADAEDIAMGAVNDVLGGSFTARINMNLREDKHWSYGARSILVDARGQRPFFVFAPVQTDKTRESLAEIRKELTDILGDRPASEDELEKVKDKATLTLPGRWETAEAVRASLGEIVQFGLPDDYWTTYAGRVRALDLAAVKQAGQKLLHPDRVVWVVVGDRAKIEAGIKELNLGEIKYIDADGNPVQRTAQLR